VGKIPRRDGHHGQSSCIGLVLEVSILIHRGAARQPQTQTIPKDPSSAPKAEAECNRQRNPPYPAFSSSETLIFWAITISLVTETPAPSCRRGDRHQVHISLPGSCAGLGPPPYAPFASVAMASSASSLNFSLTFFETRRVSDTEHMRSWFGEDLYQSVLSRSPAGRPPAGGNELGIKPKRMRSTGCSSRAGPRSRRRADRPGDTHPGTVFGGQEADAFLPVRRPNDLFEPRTKSATTDEQDVGGVHGREFLCGCLRPPWGGTLVPFLENLEQGLLNTIPKRPGDGGVLSSLRLICRISSMLNDALLGALHVQSLLEQAQDECS